MNKAHSGSDKIHAALKKLKNEATAKEVELIELVASVYESVKEKKDEVVDKVKDTATAVNTSVHYHPWYYMAGAAALGFAIGCCIRKSKK